MGRYASNSVQTRRILAVNREKRTVNPHPEHMRPVADSGESILCWKADLAGILPIDQGDAIKTVRAPEGCNDACFFQKNLNCRCFLLVEVIFFPSGKAAVRARAAVVFVPTAS